MSSEATKECGLPKCGDTAVGGSIDLLPQCCEMHEPCSDRFSGHCLSDRLLPHFWWPLLPHRSHVMPGAGSEP